MWEIFFGLQNFRASITIVHHIGALELTIKNYNEFYPTLVQNFKQEGELSKLPSNGLKPPLRSMHLNPKYQPHPTKECFPQQHRYFTWHPNVYNLLRYFMVLEISF